MLKNGGIKLEQIKITLRDFTTGNLLPVYINVADNSLSHRWLSALNHLLQNIIWKRTTAGLAGTRVHAQLNTFVIKSINQLQPLIRLIWVIKSQTILTP